MTHSNDEDDFNFDDDIPPKCGCGKKGQDAHTCPFNVDIHDDDVTLCNCCEDCEQECCDDI